MPIKWGDKVSTVLKLSIVNEFGTSTMIIWSSSFTENTWYLNSHTLY